MEGYDELQPRESLPQQTRNWIRDAEIVGEKRTSDGIDSLHFDYRQYNMIAWKDAADLKVRLQQRIEAVIGPPDPQP